MGFSFRKIAATGLLAGSLALGGCLYDDYGYGGVGYGIAGGYGDGYYGNRYGYGGGWYDDFYYPGAGYYVYDRGGRRSRWTDGQRRYWERHHSDRAFRDGGRPRYDRDRRGWGPPGGGDRGPDRIGRGGDRPGYRSDAPRPGPGPGGIGRGGFGGDGRDGIGRGGAFGRNGPDGIGRDGPRRGGDGFMGRVRDRIDRRR